MKIPAIACLAATMLITSVANAENFGDIFARCYSAANQGSGETIEAFAKRCEARAQQVKDAEIEADQDRQFTLCVAERRVDAGDIRQKQAYDACLREAGIVDFGEVARTASLHGWRACTMKEAKELDDGISPVAEIARAVILPCSQAWNAYVATLAMPPRTKRKMVNGFEQYATDEGVRAVLTLRRSIRESKAKK